MSLTARVTGTVLRVENINGTSKATGNPYSMTVVRVLVGESGMADVVLPRETRAVPARGDEVDYLVDISSSARINVNVASDFPAYSAA